MTAVFGIPLLVGFVVMLMWIAATAVAATVDGWERVDPELRFGAKGRLTLAALLGFGMGGMSTLYAGNGALLSVCGGVAGAIGLGLVAMWLPPESDG